MLFLIYLFIQPFLSDFEDKNTFTGWLDVIYSYACNCTVYLIM